MNKEVYFTSLEPQILGEFGKGETELVFTVGIHGDEVMPVRAVQKILPELGKTEFLRLGKVKFIVCNVAAMAQGKRFLEADLNDVFPGDANGNFEERLALKILPLVNNAKFVVDLHTGHDAPPFGVLPTRSKQQLELLEKSGIEKIVMFESHRVMVNETKCGVGIETGPHESESSIATTIKVVKTCLNSFGFTSFIDGLAEGEHEYFDIVSKLTLEQGRKMSESIDFREFEALPAKLFLDNAKKETVYPFLINPQRTYADIYAYLAYRLSREELLAKIR
ncbi:succinylglutamate desuccinylase/aspartoacylase family protein [Patescibacteria group bacterium]|nr:succinylglutamate desuccinylase/aspartoacylase family protein [Patescibacteria group bacterium]